jgi:murein DD-endopeptidase MepM/ murein hydrolase activator NlpD
MIKSLGFNMPQAPTVDVNAPTVDAAANTAPLETYNQGQQLVAQSVQQSLQTSQRVTQSNQQTQQQLEANNRAIAQTAIDTSKVTQAAASNFKVSLDGVGDSVRQMLDYQLKKQQIEGEEKDRLRKQLADQLEAEEKAQRGKRHMDAVMRMEHMRDDWVKSGKFDAYGTSSYLVEARNIIAKADIDSDNQVALMRQAGEEAMRYSQRIESERIDKAKKLDLIQSDTNILSLTMPASVTLAKISNSENVAPETMRSLMSDLDKQIENVMSQTQYPVLDRAAAVQRLLEAGSKGMSTSNAAYVQIMQKAESYKNVAAFAAQQNSLVVSGAKSYQQAHDDIRVFALKNGLSDYNPPDVNAGLKSTADAMRLTGDIRELREKQALSEIEKLSADTSVISALAIDAVMSPAALAELRKEKGNDVNVEAALKVAEDFIEYRTKGQGEYATKRQTYVNEALQVSDSFNTWFVSATKPQAAATQSPQLAQALAILQGQGVTPQAVQEGRVTPEQIALIQQSKSSIIQGINQQIANLDSLHYAKLKEFGNYGISLDLNETKRSREQLQVKLDGYREKKRAIEQQSTQVYPDGMQSAFKYGTSSKTNTLSRMSYGGRKVTVPFLLEDAKQIPALGQGQKFGARRGPERTHDGLDFAVPEGTKLLSMVGGTIYDVGLQGTYGNIVEVKGDDGFHYFYAHLQASNVVKGQRVEAGEIIALSGNTGGGLSTGPHLHLETFQRRPDGSHYNLMNPLDHLSAHDFSKSAVKPRAGYSTSPLIPQGAIPLGNNRYMLRGKIHTINGGVTQTTSTSVGPSPLTQLTDGAGVTAPPTAGISKRAKTAKPIKPAGYSTAQPLKQSWTSRNVEDYKGVRLPQDFHHGYSQLQRDPALAKEINRVANKYNMPGVWLADLIAYETGGKFTPDVGNGMGFYGLIQFGAAAMQDLGVTRQQLTGLTAAQQMKYVDAYLALQMRYAGVKELKGPEWLVAAVNQGHTVLKDVDRRGEAAVLDPRNSDGYTTLHNYMKTLGKYSGRQYDYLGNRTKRVSQVVHSRPRHSCTTCIAMRQEPQEFRPHEAPLNLSTGVSLFTRSANTWGSSMIS